MNTEIPHIGKRLIGLVVILSLGAAAAAAAPPILTKVLLRSGLSGDESREVLVLSGELAVGGVIPWHTHPGDEYATVLEGAVQITVSGKPPKRYAAGEAYHNARGSVHETRNVGEGTLRLLSTFVVDQGQPISSPAGGQTAR